MCQLFYSALISVKLKKKKTQFPIVVGMTQETPVQWWYTDH